MNVEREAEFSAAIHDSSESLEFTAELSHAERTRAAALHRVVQALRTLPRAPMPPATLAADTASQIALSARLESARVAAPPGFALSVAHAIHADALPFPLRALTPVRAPAGFAAEMAGRIASDAAQTARVEPRVAAPPGFAAALSARIAADAEAMPVLHALPRVSAPVNFAHNVALRISLDAIGEAETDTLESNDRAPLYFIAALLSGVAVALVALTWPYASVAGQALFETLRLLPEGILLPVLAVALLAALSVVVSRRVRLPAALAAFGVAAALVVPQAVPFFGSAQISGSPRLGSIVRFAGDITVSGEVRGDVIAVGGNVRLAPGARVSGRVLTFLGDVNLPGESKTSGVVSAVLGTLNSEGQLEGARTQAASLPGLSAASALRPFRALVTAGTWQWWYFGLLLAVGGALLLLPRLRHAFQHPLRLEAGRSLGLGVLLLFLTVPAVALGGLSLIGAPFALLLGVFTLIAFSSGAALALTEFGALVLRGFGVTKAGLWRLIPGFTLFGVALALYAPLAVTLWLLLGAWGAGALLIAVRQGALVSSLE